MTGFRIGISAHIAHLESSRDWQPGDRVIVPLSGRTGTLSRRAGRRAGWYVRWDEPVFGVTEGRCAIANLRRAD